MMPVHVECANTYIKRAGFSLGYRYSNTYCFSFFIKRNLSLRNDTTVITSL